MAARTATLVTVDEARRALGVSLATVWRRIRRGSLPSVRRDGRRLIPADALAASSRRREEALPTFDERHPIFRLIGAGRSGGQKPGARDKHGILASKR